MRFIRRNPAYTPEILQEPELKKQLKDISLMAREGGQVRGDVYDLIERIRKRAYSAVQEQFANKCAYCEIEVHNSDAQIDWFRPAFGAEREGGKVDQLYYMWLVGEWENLFLSCQECNKLKRNLFPISSPAKFGASINQLRRQREGILLDVCWDHPEQSLKITPDGTLLPRKSRGALTIDLLVLNRDYLCNGRREALTRFLDVWNTQVKRFEGFATQHFSPLYEVLSHKAPFVGSIYLFLWQIASGNIKRTLRLVIDSGPSDSSLRYLLRSFGHLSIDMVEPRADELIPYVPAFVEAVPAFRSIRRVLIENFKGIRYLVLEIPRFTDQNLAIVGENAAGKTSVLQAIALGLAGPRESNRIVADARHLLFDGAFEGRVVIQFDEEDDVNEIYFNLNSHRFQGGTQRSVRVFGYGPYRLLAKREIGRARRGQTVRVSSLFDEGAKINGYHGWLGALSNEQKNDLAEVLQLLLVSRDTHVTVDSSSLKIRTNGKDHPIGSLSSGMQSVVSMCTDLMEALYSAGESVLRDGFVFIVDELDAHLHPAWRLGIIPRLRRAFPNAQIIFSTHDPLTLRGMSSSQIHVLARDEEGTVQETSARYSDGQSIDQVLTSPLFGLFSTQTLDWEEQYKEYVRLLLKGDQGTITDKEQKELSKLVEELKGAKILGDTPRERLMYAVIDRFLARKQQEAVDWDDGVIDDLAKTVQASIDDTAQDKSR